MNRVDTKLRSADRTTKTANSSYIDIMVLLDGSLEDDIRLAHAEAIAARFDAHLTGLHAHLLPDMTLYAGEYGGVAIAELLEMARDEGAKVHERLIERFKRLGVPNEIRKLEDFPGLLEAGFATEVRWADLFVVSCPYNKSELERWSQVIETALFESGHGI